MNVMNIGKTTHLNLSADELLRAALARGEGVLAANGALTVKTGKRTGRSPTDRFIVQDEMTQTTVNWDDRNQGISPVIFDKLWDKALHYLQDKTVFVSHLAVGEDKRYQLPVTVVTEQAWHSLFVYDLFIRTLHANYDEKGWLMLNASGLKLQADLDGVKSEAALIIDFSKRKILLCGLEYGGEMKKAMFSILNFLLPVQDVLPMHCAANKGEKGDVALFFGLSGTGKTTLSADPERYLIGDDEHGWSKEGVFNFEGGCYAKCIDLQEDKEPVIWNAIRHTALLENVVLNEQGIPDYADSSLTQNTRAAYPREHIPLRVNENAAGHPHAVVFLTCDLYGVLPPVALLNESQAAYYFLSGYTALVGSTEVGSSAAIKPTFSTCFGAPFFPRPPKIYADLLIKRLHETGAKVYLVNTGWHKGAYGQGGERFSIPTTRAVIKAIVTGEAAKADYTILPGLDLAIPRALNGVDTHLLDPRSSWSDQGAYEENQARLRAQFRENFKRFEKDHAHVL